MAFRTGLLALLAALALSSGAAAATSPLRTVSTRGAAVSATDATGEALAWAQSTNIPKGSFRLVTQRGDVYFYSVGSFSGDHCFGQGGSPATPGSMHWTCNRLFPSPQVPVLTTYVAFLNPGQGRPAPNAKLRFASFSGLAADGVESVELTGPTGELIAKTRVVHNTFVFPASDLRHGAFRGTAELTAHDHAGKAVYYNAVNVGFGRGGGGG